MIRQIADTILAFPKTLIIAFLILTTLSIWPALQVEADFNLERFFPVGDQTIADYQQLTEEFGRDDNILIVAFQDDELFSPPVLNDIRKITRAFSDIPHIKRVNSLWNSERIKSEGGTLKTESYFEDSAPLKEVHFEQIRDEMLNDPFVSGILLGDDAQTTAIYLTIEEEKNHFEIREKIISEMDEVLASFDRYDFKRSGIPYFRNQYVHMLNREIIVYITVASFFILLLLWYLFRNVYGVLIPISIVWITIFFTLSVLSLTGGYFEILSSTIAPILLCVGVADSVHMLTKYNDARRQGMNNKSALREALMILGTATLLTSVTTAIGFGTLMTSNVIPMRSFGAYTAAGVIIAFIVTILLLPSFMQLVRIKRPIVQQDMSSPDHLGRILRTSHTLARRYPARIVTISLLVVILVGAGITQIRVNNLVFDDVGTDSPLIEQSDFIGEHLSPQFPMEFVIDTGLENGVYDPDLLKRIAAFESFLKEYDEIKRTTSLTTLLQRIHLQMSPDAAATDPLPDSRAMIAQYLLLFELTGSDGIESVTDFNYEKVRVSALMHDVGSYRINQMRKEIESYLADNFEDEHILHTGTTILVADLTGNIVQSLAISIMLAFLFISLIMAMMFKNIKLVFISLAPNLIPLIITAGVMGYFGIDIKPSTAVIFTIAFGIAVDDSIHFLSRFRIETLRGLSLEDALKVTTERTGRAIILTSAILLVGFGVLGTSDFHSTMLLGLLTCLTIFVAIVADLFFLPSLIYLLKPDLRKARQSTSFFGFDGDTKSDKHKPLTEKSAG